MKPKYIGIGGKSKLNMTARELDRVFATLSFSQKVEYYYLDWKNILVLKRGRLSVESLLDELNAQADEFPKKYLDDGGLFGYFGQFDINYICFPAGSSFYNWNIELR